MNQGFLMKKAVAVFTFGFILALVWAFFLPAGAGPHPPAKLEIVSVEKAPGCAAALQTLGLDLLFEWEGRIFILAAAEDLRALNRAKIPYLLESYKFPALDPRSPQLQGGINGDYHSSAELEADLQALERAFPQLAQLFSIGLSLENRNIYALKISDNVSLDEEEAEVLFLGCHHAREWISVEVPYLLARFLLENYPSDPAVRRAVDHSEIWIVPLVNPDGLEYTIRFYRYWRKNRRLNGDGTYGVDLNRNYGYNWAYDDRGSSSEPASEIYRGTGPFSEPESRAVRDFFFQRDFQALISYHSFSQVILYPWGYTTAPTDQDALLKSLAALMSNLMRAVNGRIYGFGRAGDSLYLTNGDTTDWAFGIAGIPAFTIELPPVDQLGGGFFNAERDIDPIFRENLPAALALIDWSILDFGAAPDPPRETSCRALREKNKLPGLRLPVYLPGRD
ncbi:MAG: M14 family metallopeptidase [Candidatus Aminicenantales bacterium]